MRALISAPSSKRRNNPMPVQVTQDELTFCYELLDAYAGEESKRVHWLADQWTSYGQELSEAEWARLEAKAEEIIGLWREARRVAA
jgi:hypothetical protein